MGAYDDDKWVRYPTGIKVKHSEDADSKSFEEVDVRTNEIASKVVSTLVTARMMISDMCGGDILEIFDAIARENGIELVEVPNQASRH